MKALEEKILNEGKVLPGNVLKVGNFLNQRIDVAFMDEMGKEVARLFAGEKITKVLTIEASGIPFAYACASALGVPMAFAKKHKSSNVGNDVYTTSIHSYTHGNDYEAIISREYIEKDDCVLLVDDFLACGNSLIGLGALAAQAGAKVVGAAVAIEKGFQGGGDALRAKGMHIESLALIESMSDNGLTFRR